MGRNKELFEKNLNEMKNNYAEYDDDARSYDDAEYDDYYFNNCIETVTIGSIYK